MALAAVGNNVFHAAIHYIVKGPNKIGGGGKMKKNESQVFEFEDTLSNGKILNVRTRICGDGRMYHSCNITEAAE